MSSDYSAPNPNILIVGKPGRGKGALAKSLALRVSDPATRPAPIIWDPAGDDFAPLADLLGGKPFRIPDQPVKIDPLQLLSKPTGPSDDGAGEW